jgi:hypothetical protein
MTVRISGPNLRDQTKGSFHVHREGCADIKKAAKSDPAFSKREAHVLDVASAQDVAEFIYADQIAENGDSPLDYLSDFHFAPCTADLPLQTSEQEVADRPDLRPTETVDPDSELEIASQRETLNPQQTNNHQESIMATRTQRSSRKNGTTTEPVQTVEVPEDQTPAFVISPDALDKVEEATNGTVTADALASAIQDAPDMEVGDSKESLDEPVNESTADEDTDKGDGGGDDNDDNGGGEAQVQAQTEATESTPRRTVNRGTYTEDQKARSAWITEKYARTGPDVVKAIELATRAVLELEDNQNLTLHRLETAFADPTVCEAIRANAAESCRYVSKTNVPRALEAHIAQLENAK